VQLPEAVKPLFLPSPFRRGASSGAGERGWDVAKHAGRRPVARHARRQPNHSALGPSVSAKTLPRPLRGGSACLSHVVDSSGWQETSAALPAAPPLPLVITFDICHPCLHAGLILPASFSNRTQGVLPFLCFRRHRLGVFISRSANDAARHSPPLLNHQSSTAFSIPVLGSSVAGNVIVFAHTFVISCLSAIIGRLSAARGCSCSGPRALFLNTFARA